MGGHFNFSFCIPFSMTPMAVCAVWRANAQALHHKTGIIDNAHLYSEAYFLTCIFGMRFLSVPW
jgi:hypothetical protein